MNYVAKITTLQVISKSMAKKLKKFYFGNAFLIMSAYFLGLVSSNKQQAHHYR